MAHSGRQEFSCFHYKFPLILDEQVDPYVQYWACDSESVYVAHTCRDKDEQVI